MEKDFSLLRMLSLGKIDFIIFHGSEFSVPRGLSSGHLNLTQSSASPPQFDASGQAA